VWALLLVLIHVEDKLEKIDVNHKSKVMSFLAAAYYLSKMPKCASN
jgi:hypothetical protein